MSFVPVCYRCSGEVTEKDHVAVVRFGTEVILLDVRAGVCEKCGEVLYDPRTVRRMEDARRDLEAGNLAGFRVVGHAYRA